MKSVTYIRTQRVPSHAKTNEVFCSNRIKPIDQYCSRVAHTNHGLIVLEFHRNSCPLHRYGCAVGVFVVGIAVQVSMPSRAQITVTQTSTYTYRPWTIRPEIFP